MLDILVALTLIALLVPLVLAMALRARRRGSTLFDRQRCAGRFQVPFDHLTFASAGRVGGAGALFNVLGGSMSLAGPRPIAPREAAGLPPAARDRFLVRPGILSPFAIRRRLGIAFESEIETDIDYVYRLTTGRWLGVIARSLFGALLGGKASSEAASPAIADAGTFADAEPETSEWLDFFGVRIANLTMNDAIDKLLDEALRPGTAMVNFVNPHCLNVAYVDDAYRAVLDRSTFILPDGIGLHQGCRILGCRFNSNVNGTDLFPRLCERLAGEGASLYLLGASPGAAEASAAAMVERFPNLVIAGTRDGYFPAGESGSVVEEVNASGADVLLVAMGVPRQELWIDAHRSHLEVPLVMGVGGLFDYYSGRIPRAPEWVREVGMEWVWRLLQEPGRMWRRYLVGNFLFMYRVWKQARGVSPRTAAG